MLLFTIYTLNMLNFPIALLNLYSFVFESDNVELFKWAERNHPTETMEDFIEILSTCLSLVRKNILVYLQNSYKYDRHVGNLFRELVFIRLCTDHSKFKTFYEVLPNKKSASLTFAIKHLELVVASSKDDYRLAFLIIDYLIGSNNLAECLFCITKFGKMSHFQYFFSNVPTHWVLNEKIFDLIVTPIVYYGKIDMLIFLFKEKKIYSYSSKSLVSAICFAFQSYHDYFFLNLLYKKDPMLVSSLLALDEIIEILEKTRNCCLRLSHRRRDILWIAYKCFGYRNFQKEHELQSVLDEMDKKWMMFARNAIDKKLLDRDVMSMISSFI